MVLLALSSFSRCWRIRRARFVAMVRTITVAAPSCLSDNSRSTWRQSLFWRSDLAMIVAASPSLWRRSDIFWSNASRNWKWPKALAITTDADFPPRTSADHGWRCCEWSPPWASPLSSSSKQSLLIFSIVDDLVWLLHDMCKFQKNIIFISMFYSVAISHIFIPLFSLCEWWFSICIIFHYTVFHWFYYHFLMAFY